MAKTYAQFGSDTTRCTRSVNNTKVTANTANQTSAARSDIALSNGKWYVEYQPEIASQGNFEKWGVCLDATSTASMASSAANIIGGGNSGDQTTTAWRRIAVDIDAGKVWVDNLGAGWSSGGNPETGANPTATFTPGSAVRIAVRLGSFYQVGVQEFNFGASAFANTVPSGFAAGWYTGGNDAVEVACGVGSLIVSGMQCAVAQDRSIACSVGAIVATGAASSIGQDRSIACIHGAVACAGSQCAVAVGVSIRAGSGARTVTGSACSVVQDRSIACGTGHISVQGQPCSVSKGRVIACGTATRSVTGNTASLVKDQTIAVAGYAQIRAIGLPCRVQQGAANSPVTGQRFVTGQPCQVYKRIRATLNLGSEGESDLSVQGVFGIRLSCAYSEPEFWYASLTPTLFLSVSLVESETLSGDCVAATAFAIDWLEGDIDLVASATIGRSFAVALEDPEEIEGRAMEGYAVAFDDAEELAAGLVIGRSFAARWGEPETIYGEAERRDAFRADLGSEIEVWALSGVAGSAFTAAIVEPETVALSMLTTRPFSAVWVEDESISASCVIGWMLSSSWDEGEDLMRIQGSFGSSRLKFSTYLNGARAEL